MRLEIDQSGKIENTSHDTILAISNKLQKSICIPAKVKRKLQRFFRLINKPRLFIYASFAAGIWILLGFMKNKQRRIFIDTEYKGHEQVLEAMLEKISPISLNITFKRVGKSSPAHDLASKVAHGKKKADKKIRYGEIVSVIQKMTEISVETRAT